jgi:ribulose-5-phosphate 4-epimerase/fuculose-1-phosphate aldolase
MYEELKRAVWEANIELHRQKLTICSWGNVSGIDRGAAVVLEQIAAMALGTININPKQNEIPQHLCDKHYLRKHGKNAYYGQK